jgi:hypothetical protein
MQSLTRFASAVLIVLGAVLASAAAAAHAGTGNGCTGYTTGGGWYVQCSSGGASGGGGTTSSCTWTSNIDRYWPHASKYLPKAPKGYVYLVELCGQTFGTPQLVANGGALTPQQLAQEAYTQLSPPAPDPRTAPPRGKDGMVGLPEWFWVPPATWVTQTRSIQVGPVWATVTARPTRLTVSPGGSQPAMSCRGPGTPYDPARPAAAQHSDCAYLYTRPSDGLPGNAYQVTVTITWTATWVGSGGTGGTLAPLTRTLTYPQPVAQGEALYSGGTR